MNIGVRVSFWIMVFSGYMPSSGIAVSQALILFLSGEGICPSWHQVTPNFKIHLLFKFLENVGIYSDDKQWVI